MKASFFAAAALLLFSGCNKIADTIINNGNKTGRFIKYTIPAGEHYCDKNGFRTMDGPAVSFAVIFDSSAVYQVSASNQKDINKLFGFSDNNSTHHQYSARFGWRWSDQALRLFAYVYNEGTVRSRELKKIAIGEEVNCAITVEDNHYFFTVNGENFELPRLSTTAVAKGYMLYPYFGGDESAPHEIRISIREN
jgi:hypothetical protein